MIHRVTYAIGMSRNDLGRLKLVCQPGINSCVNLESNATAAGAQMHPAGVPCLLSSRMRTIREPLRLCPRLYSLRAGYQAEG